MSTTLTARRGIGAFATAGGVVVLVTGLGFLVLAAVWFTQSTRAPAVLVESFAADQEVVVPGSDREVLGTLVVYGTDHQEPGSNQDTGCAVVSSGGSARSVTFALGQDDVVTPDGTRVALDEVRQWRAGDRVTCSGDQSSDFAPFAPFALGAVAPGHTAGVVAVVAGLVALVFGGLLLGGGTLALRRR